GLPDLLVWAADGPRMYRNLGREGSGLRWRDVTETTFGRSRGEGRQLASARALALGDVTGDGATDMVTGDAAGSLSLWRNSGTRAAHSIRVQLKGRVSNRLGVGAKIDMRAGSLSTRMETSAATPAIAPADLVFGLGPRDSSDVIRVL